MTVVCISFVCTLKKVFKLLILNFDSKPKKKWSDLPNIHVYTLD